MLHTIKHNGLISLFSFPVPRLHASRPAQRHRGREGRNQEAPVHTATEEVGSQRWRKVQEGRNYHIRRWSCDTGQFG